MISTLKVNEKEVRLTNLDRMLWPESRYTKHDLIKYYIRVAPYLLPHLQNRPLVVQRFPAGAAEKGFYQKNIPEGAPSWLRTCLVEHHDDKETIYPVADNIETLVWLGNQACLELHPWLSSVGSLDMPDFAVFDLDPMENSTFKQVCQVAIKIKDILSDLNLECYPKLSGATGLQLYLPVKPVYTYRQVREFVEQVCIKTNQEMPEITTIERKVSQREGKLYLDYLQNVRGKTLAAVYSPRPQPGAPVSIPVTWKEVNDGTVLPGDYNIANIYERLAAYGDLFRIALINKQELPFN